jgi:hypothetical protein
MNFSIESLEFQNENLKNDLKNSELKINHKFFKIQIMENECLIAALKGLNTKPIINEMNYATKQLICSPFDLKNEEFLKELINEK